MFLQLDEAVASRAVFVIISGSDGRANGQTDGRTDGVEMLLEMAK